MANRGIQLLFLALVVAANVFTFRSQALWSWISMACAGGLWLVFYLRNVKGVPGLSRPRFELVALVVGVFFVFAGVWARIKFLPGTPSVAGLFLMLPVALLPICCGLVIIRSQLRLLRK